MIEHIADRREATFECRLSSAVIEVPFLQPDTVIKCLRLLVNSCCGCRADPSVIDRPEYSARIPRVEVIEI